MSKQPRLISLTTKYEDDLRMKAVASLLFEKYSEIN